MTTSYVVLLSNHHSGLWLHLDLNNAWARPWIGTDVSEVLRGSICDSFAVHDRTEHDRPACDRRGNVQQIATGLWPSSWAKFLSSKMLALIAGSGFGV